MLTDEEIDHLSQRTWAFVHGAKSQDGADELVKIIRTIEKDTAKRCAAIAKSAFTLMDDRIVPADGVEIASIIRAEFKLGGSDADR
jgi:hypothetical protein